jgi:hypothetical protein
MTKIVGYGHFGIALALGLDGNCIIIADSSVDNCIV